ncbi:hypothetical protein [Xenophilus azovorans]|uniref:hypothetical protein n=1 Tax=Xenophilus azovorans TaxID=151755 RepID=UPI000571DD26|nr:hypothetical protein [Xenophilus azovorans]
MFDFPMKHPRPMHRLWPLCLLAACGLAPVAAMAAGSGGGQGDTTTTVIDNPGGGTNRIEVTGNSVRSVQTGCTDGVANVNSVNIDGQSLKGRTIIVQGRNVRDVHVDGKDCADKKGQRPAGANVNSITIQ